MRLMISGDESGIESTQPDSVFSSSMGVDKVSKPEFSLICCNLLGHERFKDFSLLKKLIAVCRPHKSSIHIGLRAVFRDLHLAFYHSAEKDLLCLNG